MTSVAIEHKMTTLQAAANVCCADCPVIAAAYSRPLLLLEDQ